MKNLVCAIYNHPEAYPPTLNAIQELASIYDNVYVLYLPNLVDAWTYPANVVLVPAGDTVISITEQAKLSAIKKVALFISFTCTLLKLKVKYRPATILLYDALPLFAYFLLSKITSKPKVLWYHNHDVIGTGHRKYSVAWFAARFERDMFSRLDVFTLPADERKRYFPMHKLKGVYFCVPNYPSRFFYSRFVTRPIDRGGCLKLIYQGSVSDGHGLEQVIHYIAKYNRDAALTIIGNANEVYKKKITDLVDSLGLQERVSVLLPVNYARLPAITARHNIGLAINTPHNIIYATGGTASNKVYEYAAVGLPILYFDNEHYNGILSKYKWAFAVALTAESIKDQIDKITANRVQLSAVALSDFNDSLNFENAFFATKAYLEHIYIVTIS